MRWSRNVVIKLAAVALLASCSPGAPKQAAMDKREREYVRQMMSSMRDPIELVSFSQAMEPTGEKTAALYDEVAGLTGKITRRRYDLHKDGEAAKAYGVTLAPAAVMKKGTAARIFFYGTPGGYEFTPFIEGLVRLSGDNPDISAPGRQKLKDLKIPVKVKIFVTPS